MTYQMAATVSIKNEIKIAPSVFYKKFYDLPFSINKKIFFFLSQKFIERQSQAH